MTSDIIPMAASRPEVVELAAAIEKALPMFTGNGQVGEVVVLGIDIAQDLLGLIADLCPQHVTCSACGEACCCTPCGLGDQSAWCWAPAADQGPLCPGCKTGACTQCRAGWH